MTMRKIVTNTRNVLVQNVKPKQINNREWKLAASAMKAKPGCEIFAVEVLNCA